MSVNREKLREPDVNVNMWAVYAPNGDVQFRSIAATKREAKQYILHGSTPETTWQDYANAGFHVSKVEVTVLPKD